MKSRILIIAFVSFFSAATVHAQEVGGTVYELTPEGKEVPLPDASIYFAGTTVGTSTDDRGVFRLVKPDDGSAQLVISFTGYMSDTIPAEGTAIKVVLDRAVLLQGVEVTGSGSATYISSLATPKTEVITSDELSNNACCNLSESFESNPTIDVSFTDAVTGARQIQMLGLAGKYAQILTDLLPTVRGLGITYGLNYIPGPWVESINLSKGAGSVVNGYESITGQVDVELVKPEESEKLYINLYGNTDERLEANVYSAQKLSSKWNHMTLLHGSTMQNEMDHNHDHFLDMPLNTTLEIMDRWKFNSRKNVESMFGVKYLYDDRLGGSTHFDEQTDKLTTYAYGLGLTTHHAEAFTKTSYGFTGKEFQSIGLQVSAIYHNQEGYFGLRQYSGREKSLFANLIFLSIIDNTKNKFKAGLSYLYDQYDERFDTLELDRTESVPGAYFEYTYDNLKKLSLIAGVRGDVHNTYGFIFTPRLHLKYKLTENLIVRGSGGSGFRVANIFAENSAYLASSREWIIQGELQPEKAWNYGVNVTQKFFAGTHEGTISLDLYRTNFTNQVIVDADTDPTKVFFYNLNGKSFSNSFQADVSYEWFRNFNTRIAYKYYDVKETFNGELLEVPLVPRHRALLTLTYKTRDNHWEFSSTNQWVGEQRLPDTQSNPEIYRAPQESPSYFRLLGQVTYILKQWEFYVGGENLTNFTQDETIIASNDPFGPYFDTSIIWGPITGRTFYAGLRFKIN